MALRCCQIKITGCDIRAEQTGVIVSWFLEKEQISHLHLSFWPLHLKSPLMDLPKNVWTCSIVPTVTYSMMLPDTQWSLFHALFYWRHFVSTSQPLGSKEKRFILGFFVLLVWLQQTIAVTFRGILHSERRQSRWLWLSEPLIGGEGRGEVTVGRG